ncbi:hypothetical protein Thiowin_00119 [Thiorhodovibrio winogradskyi]|uniref:Uncharacterized protein n=1 Tax=Thiorhodovibrio winogradskyi TaxID=77007 RepID=A0ABZ0S4U7_9GAMM|nr:hypothetical protein [Thiorhodovibrio winogradskyi]
MSRDPRIPWHELLGKAHTDALIGLPYSVSTEEELALRSQRLDVLIIEQAPAAGSDGRDPQRTKAALQTPNASPTPEPYADAPERPDGLEDLAAHNLLSLIKGARLGLISVLNSSRIPGTVYLIPLGW